MDYQSITLQRREEELFGPQELREVCQDFLGDIGDFQKIADSFIVIFDAVSKEVETEKMKVYDFKFDLIARILQGNVESKTLMTLKMDFW